jgi:hypothetical protein
MGGGGGVNVPKPVMGAKPPRAPPTAECTVAIQTNTIS